MEQLITPVLFLVFNRPDTTRQVFEKIREARPQKLYIAADGPRTEKEGESHRTDEVRNIFKTIDWPCEVHTLFRDKNLGCGKAVSEGITWFFEQEEEGIILEDDCLPDNSFFRFCSELLVKYRNDEEIMCISGSNLLGSPWTVEGQSYFWGISSIWGWASWKRAWNKYDFEMEGWQNESVKEILRKSLHTEEWYKFYHPMFEEAHKGTLDTWDVQWLYAILLKSGLSISPEVNLIKNIGFGSRATHTHNSNNPFSNLPTGSINFPLQHPVHRDVDIDYLKKMHIVLHPVKKIQPAGLKRILNLLRFRI